jgi:hypothetical protein
LVVPANNVYLNIIGLNEVYIQVHRLYITNHILSK